MRHESRISNFHPAPPSPPIALPVFSDGRGPALVMLGGGTTGAAGFAAHAQELAKDFRVIRLQTLNIDRAQKKQPLPPGYSIKVESNAMARSLDQLRLTGPVNVVGHSLGALVALDFALDHPDRVRTLVLSEPPAFWVVPPDEYRASVEMKRVAELVRHFGPMDEPTDDQLVAFLGGLGNCDAKPPARAEAGWEEWVARRASLRGLSSVLNHTDDVNRLQTFRRPVLIVTGANTAAFHRRINDILAAKLPVVERADLPGGHGATSTARDDFVVQLRTFLSRHGNV